MTRDDEDRPKNGWGEWSRHVLAELERLDKCAGDQAHTLGEMRVEMAQLRERLSITSALYGLIGGAIPVAVVILWMFIK